MNLFVGYACNLRCPYCFARALHALYPQRIDRDNFEKFLAWCIRVKLYRLAFIGGEPTLHPRLAEMVERTAQAGVVVSIFTNGLGSPALMERLSGNATNFIVNCNPPELLSSGQQRRLHDNLARLRASGARLTFSKNFSPRYAEYTYLLESVIRYDISFVRCDISRPDPFGSNDYAPAGATARLLAAVTAFAERCASLGVGLGIDCCLRMCETEPEQRAFLERFSAKFTGICHPSLDVHPDLSVSYCLPLHDLRVPDVTAFSDEEALRLRFAEAARPFRGRNAGGECRSCDDFMRRCQGGCMAQTGNAGVPPGTHQHASRNAARKDSRVC
ncbi:MAG: 4Fe-4S cluster-binding domain-containing protein [Desulfovibrio sp.]|nr:4Fe-4S cluster-binding domain-containing protein [Desulfovibrio sp.]